MLSKHIAFYQSLSENEQYIIRAVALVGKNIDEYMLARIISYKRKISPTSVKDTIRLCVKNTLLEKDEYYHNININMKFMVWIYPLTSDVVHVGDNRISDMLYYGHSGLIDLRNFLYALFFDREKQKKTEEALLDNYNTEQLQALGVILQHPLYEPFIPFIHPEIMKKVVENAYLDSVQHLNSLHLLEEDKLKKYYDASFWISIYRGKFMGSLRLLSPEAPLFSPFFIEASYQLLNKNDKEQAMLLFEKGMKKQRTLAKGTYMPLRPEYALYYMVTLLLQPSEVYAPIIQKHITASEKKEYSYTHIYFYIMCQYMKNNKEYIKENTITLQKILSSTQKQFYNIWAIITLYFIAEKPQDCLKEAALSVVEKAYTGGYTILALEAAFALNEWWPQEAAVSQFYAKVRKDVDYEPALSRIERPEDWVKGLNALLGIGSKKTSKTTTGKKEEGKHRVAYLLDPENMYIQPILQTNQAKGWTTGRNISMKSFFEGKTEGMTEQDYRISKCVHYTSSYYSDNTYEFKDTVFKELIGHPYLLLSGGNEVGVELLEGIPTVNVRKTNKGYHLSSSLKHLDKKLFVQKETNTRYHVYSLTEQQLETLKTIKLQNITVPEKGKDLLLKVLSHFSTTLTVHSDLMHTASTKLKQVAADPKVRVQLLPFGNGFKAELFAKPFGNTPPYCKPGLGGKVLIATEKGEQLQAVRDLKKEKEYAERIYNDIQTLDSVDPSDDLITFDNPLDSLYLLDILEKHQDISVIEWPEGEKYKIRKQIDFKNINLKITSKSNWFELQGELKVDEQTVLSIQQLLELTKKRHGNFIELSNGEFLSLSEKLRKQLSQLSSFAEIGKKGVTLNKFSAMAMGDLFDDFEQLKADKAWKEFQKQIQDAGQKEVSVPDNLQAELRPYQEEGFRWMARLSDCGAGACLADDMGLGKTVQSLSILLHRSHLGPAMVICPVSVQPNWINESCKFAPSLRIKTLMAGNRKETLDTLEAGDLLIISYGLLQSEESLLAAVPLATLILDEAHTIKNYTTKTSKAAMMLNATFKVALTGTPIQNHLGEMWNLFNFINPGLLGSLSHFTDHFVKPDNDSARKYLKKLITPFILRRTKTAVLDELPPKTEIIRKIQFSDEETAFYEALRRDAILSLESSEEANGTKHLKALAEITRLRQACCHPALVNPDIPIQSTKLATFIDITRELKENKHRAIVFSQFVTHLALVKKALDKESISYQYLDGSTPLAEREKSVKRFQAGESDLFLISLKAGGLGLNLTAADFVIHLDPWWNPAVEDQASDRAHRIGQTRPVTVYRLVAQNTIEEKIIQLHNTKRNLADSLLEGSDQSAKLSVKELISLIKGE